MWNKAEMAHALLERAKDIRLVASDLDGTLLDGSSRLSARTVAAVELARRRDIAFTICTGRSFYELEDIPRTLQLTAPVVCRNGAEIVDPVSGDTLFQALIPTDEGAAFMAYCVKEHIDVCLTTPDAALFPQGSYFEDFLAKRSVQGQTVDYIDENNRFDGLLHCKIILLKEQPKYPLAQAFADKLPGVRSVGSANELVDLICRDASKDAGLRWVAEHMGIGREACCAFGDFANDVPMLQYAGLSFAMENAARSVQAAADYVAPSNVEDGVAQVLETLFGI